jgi:hypothetical protein
MKVCDDMIQLRPNSDSTQASTDVSADLDKIASFFDIMSSILQRVFILEKNYLLLRHIKPV